MLSLGVIAWGLFIALVALLHETLDGASRAIALVIAVAAVAAGIGLLQKRVLGLYCLYAAAVGAGFSSLLSIYGLLANRATLGESFGHLVGTGIVLALFSLAVVHFTEQKAGLR